MVVKKRGHITCYGGTYATCEVKKTETEKVHTKKDAYITWLLYEKGKEVAFMGREAK